MRITKQRLKEIIKEEIQSFLPGLEPHLGREDGSSKLRYKQDIKRIMDRDGKDPFAASELVRMAAKPEKAHLVDQAAQELAAEYETVSEETGKTKRPRTPKDTEKMRRRQDDEYLKRTGKGHMASDAPGVTSLSNAELRRLNKKNQPKPKRKKK
jgi:hypothetical protein